MDQEIDEQDFDNGSVGEDETEDLAQDDNNESGTKKSNTSNFKALAKAKRELEATLKIEREEREQERLELQQWRELNADTAQEIDKSKEVDSIKEEIFILKNQEAEPHIKDIRSTMQKYNMDYKDAWKFVKMDIPAESISKTDFNLNKSAPKKAIDLINMPFSETDSLTKEQRAEWRKIHFNG